MSAEELPNNKKTRLSIESIEINAFGEVKTAKDWSLDKRCSINYTCLSKRLRSGKWPLTEKILSPKIKKKEVFAFGETKNLKDWALDKRCVVPFQTLNSRINNYKWPSELAISTPLVHEKPDSIIGKSFKNLEVLKKIDKAKDGTAIFLCKCLSCEKEFKSSYKSVRSRDGCGCNKRRNFLKNITKHGLQKNEYYSIWYNMNDRCFDKKSNHYENYGGRGITVCSEWAKGQKNELGLANFIKWTEKNPRKSKLYSLDRIDNDQGYSPKNCKWSTKSEQALNRRNKKYFISKIKQMESVIKILIKIIKNEK